MLIDISGIISKISHCGVDLIDTIIIHDLPFHPCYPVFWIVIAWLHTFCEHFLPWNLLVLSGLASVSMTTTTSNLDVSP